MRANYTGHVTSAEWRWVILVAVSLVLLAFVPFLWALLFGVAGSEWRFMGALHHYIDAAPDIARLHQGTEDRWLAQFLHTPEPHRGALIGVVYTLLGQIARITSLPSIVIFHVARVGASLFMYMALYQMAANIWLRLRSRRIFFVLAAVGSGVGWLVTPLVGNTVSYDLTQPGMFPFYASLSSVHLPLAIGGLALAASVIVIVMRPHETPMPTVENGSVMVFFISLLLVFVYPVAFLPIVLAFAANIAWNWNQSRRSSIVRLNWLLWLGAPALPMLVYYLLVMETNAIVGDVLAQQDKVAASVPLLLVSLGLVLVLALPGLWRAVRRFDQDGDQFMLLWLLAMLILGYLPIMASEPFFVGMIIPLGYFVTRATTDFWFEFIPRRRRMQLMAGLIPVLFASNLLVLSLPMQAINNTRSQDESGILLQVDYVELFRWMSDLTETEDVVLAAPSTSLWLPGWTGAHVVYGHPAQTITPEAKVNAVRDWYARSDASACDAGVSSGGTFSVDYVIYGPNERAIGPAACLDSLTLVARFGEVELYAYRNASSSP